MSDVQELQHNILTLKARICDLNDLLAQERSAKDLLNKLVMDISNKMYLDTEKLTPEMILEEIDKLVPVVED